MAPAALAVGFPEVGIFLDVLSSFWRFVEGRRGILLGPASSCADLRLVFLGGFNSVYDMTDSKRVKQKSLNDFEAQTCKHTVNSRARTVLEEEGDGVAGNCDVALEDAGTEAEGEERRNEGDLLFAGEASVVLAGAPVTGGPATSEQS